MALLLFCITSMSAPTMPAVGAGTGGLDSEWSDTWRHKQIRTGRVSFPWMLQIVLCATLEDLLRHLTHPEVWFNIDRLQLWLCVRLV